MPLGYLFLRTSPEAKVPIFGRSPTCLGDDEEIRDTGGRGQADEGVGDPEVFVPQGLLSRMKSRKWTKGKLMYLTVSQAEIFMIFIVYVLVLCPFIDAIFLGSMFSVG